MSSTHTRHLNRDCMLICGAVYSACSSCAVLQLAAAAPCNPAPSTDDLLPLLSECVSHTGTEGGSSTAALSISVSCRHTPGGNMRSVTTKWFIVSPFSSCPRERDMFSRAGCTSSRWRWRGAELSLRADMPPPSAAAAVHASLLSTIHSLSHITVQTWAGKQVGALVAGAQVLSFEGCSTAPQGGSFREPAPNIASASPTRRFSYSAGS